MSKTEQVNLDNEIEDFLKTIPDIEKKVSSSSISTNSQLADQSSPSDIPPVRSTNSTLKVGSKKTEETISTTSPPKPVKSTSTTSSKKSPKPKDYSEWSK